MQNVCQIVLKMLKLIIHLRVLDFLQWPKRFWNVLGIICRPTLLSRIFKLLEKNEKILILKKILKNVKVARLRICATFVKACKEKEKNPNFYEYELFVRLLLLLVKKMIHKI